MWVNSKEVAEILGVNLRKLQRCVAKAQKNGQKILTIDTQKTMYRYLFGRGGASGKILQIWIADEIVVTHNANLKGKEGSLREIEEFRSEISPADITSSAITTRVGNLNFITKEGENASGNDRKYPSSWGSKNDEAGASAIHSDAQDGNSSRTG